MPISKKRKLETVEDVRKLATIKSVSIVLDTEDVTDESKINSKFSYNKKSKILTIVPSLWDKKEKPVLLEIIKKAFTGGGIILKKDTQELLDSYSEYSYFNNDKGVLQFFSGGVIPPDDFTALKMSLYLRDQVSKGKNISLYKKNIRERFGERGSNIANLCTAGYFEAEFIPLIYNSVTKTEFYEYYEIAVGEKARALFVHGGMGKEEIDIEFNSMLQKALKYHMKDFRIHGLGKQNVDTIKDFFLNKIPTPEDKFIIQKGYERNEPAIVIEYVITIIYE